MQLVSNWLILPFATFVNEDDKIYGVHCWESTYAKHVCDP